MVETIIKRNGNKAVFDKNKIIGAITAAFSDCEYDVKSKKCINIIGQVADKVEQQLTNNISVEEIQDLVEKEIADIGYFDVAKAYITYRHLRTLARTEYNDLWNAIREKLSADNVENQNANVDERSFGGRLGEVSRVITKKYALDFLMSDMAKNNHLNNEIYTHDLDSYALGMHNCLSLPIDDLLANGFNTRQVDIRPANSVNTAFQLVAVLFQLQSLQQFGKITLPNQNLVNLYI